MEAERNEYTAKIEEILQQNYNLKHRLEMQCENLIQEREAKEREIEEERNEYTAKIEEILQQNYSLKHKLELECKLNENLIQENESVLDEQQRKSELLLRRLEEQNARQLKMLASEKADMAAQIEKLELQLQTKSEKMAQQSEYIKELSDKLETCRDSGSGSQEEDIKQMAQYISELEQKDKAMKMKMLDLESNVKVLSLERESLESKTRALEEDVEERTQQGNEWYRSLQSAQEECKELKAEVEKLKMDFDNDDRAESGNSLFAEVEDKRIAAERKLISVQTKYGSLEKAYQMAKQQISKQKMELTALFCRYSGEVADAAYIKSLNVALMQSRNEVESLSIQLNKAEQQERQQVQQMKVYHDAFSSTNTKKAYLKFLENEIEQLKCEKASLAKELSKKRKQFIAESDNLQEAKLQLRTSEQRCVKLTHDLSKCKQKNDEAEEKLRKEVDLRKDLELQIQLLEEQLASKRAGRKGGRQCVNPSSPMPTKIVKAKEQKVLKASSPAPSAAVVRLKGEELQNEENCSDKASSTLSAEEATDLFIAELKRDMRITSELKDPSTGATNHPERRPLGQHNLSSKLANKTLQVMDNKVNQCPQQ